MDYAEPPTWSIFPLQKLVVAQLVNNRLLVSHIPAQRNIDTYAANQTTHIEKIYFIMF